MTDTHTPVDVRVENHGSIVLLRPISDLADVWIDEHIDDEAQRYSGAIVVEPRYVDDIISGMEEGGLTVV